ncbi:MAG: carbohydrate-binding family 9-like protein [Lentisphaeria bacterium]|nr:carbohydrate-binding family 9-like protein [Lentisphaeria bacterium]
MAYVIKKIADDFVFDENWENPVWDNAEVALLEQVREESSDHTPKVEAKMLYNKKGFYVRFDVDDQYVRIVNTEFQSSVCQDSCVEFFGKPEGAKSYLNFEMNAGGTLLCFDITDHTRAENGFKDFRKLTPDEVKNMVIYHTLPKKLDAEITEKIKWSVMYFVPFELFHLEKEVVSGDVWVGNFFKCADKCSHPHWITYFPVYELNFHLPECFGKLILE